MRVKSKGLLNKAYVDGYGYRLVLIVDTEIVNYARSLAPKYLGLKSTRYEPHITIVRREAVDASAWAALDISQVGYDYDPEAKVDDRYCWLTVWSDEIVDIRTRLGLTPSRKIVDGVAMFHMTIGNFK